MLTLASFAALSAILTKGAQDGPGGVDQNARNSLIATNTVYGPTGLISVPTAFSNGLGKIRVGGSFTDKFAAPSANYGIFQDIEIGAAFLQRENASDRALGNAKATIVPSNFKFVQLGVGVIDVADTLNRTLYLVGSFDLALPKMDTANADTQAVAFKGHVGAGTGLFKDKLFGGAELLFGNRVSAIAEYDTKNVNGAIRYAHRDYFVMQLGFFEKKPYFNVSTQIRF